jgi:hypothetical protein
MFPKVNNNLKQFETIYKKYLFLSAISINTQIRTQIIQHGCNADVIFINIDRLQLIFTRKSGSI